MRFKLKIGFPEKVDQLLDVKKNLLKFKVRVVQKGPFS